MTRSEVSQVLGVLMVAYPNAELFKAENKSALERKLSRTVTLWTACLRDLDVWAVQNGLVRLCGRCKYLPTVAEVRQAAEEVLKDMEREISNACRRARNELALCDGDVEQAYQWMDSRSRKVMEAIGGKYDPEKFMRVYEQMLRSNPVGLPTGDREG